MLIKFFIPLCFLALLCQETIAQDKPKDLKDNEYFIYLKDNTLLREGDYEDRSNMLLESRFFDLNGKKIKSNQIKYYQTESGYFGIKYFGKNKKSTYATGRRLKAGEIDLFKSVKSYHAGVDSRGTPQRSTSVSYYYARGFRDMQLLNYDNLHRDLIMVKDSQHKKGTSLVIEYLEKGRKLKKTTTTLILGGLGVFLVGSVISGGTIKEGQEVRYITGMGIAIGGLLTTGFALVLPKPKKHYFRAVDEYNRMYW